MNDEDKGPIRDLLDIMSALRDPVGGCPWDLQQDFRSIAPYTIEEAYEVADAIDRNDLPALRDELGDLLLQVVFHAQMARERGAFDFGDVVRAISSKMMRRHPHVFAGERVADADAQRGAWEEHKARERAGTGDESVIAGVGRALPALMRADKLARRAARVGFDWPDPAGVAAKLREELAEVEAARQEGETAHVQEEIGDLLFTCASLARHLKVDPEEALRSANRKFERRFRVLEQLLGARGADWVGISAEELDHLWAEVKATEVPDPGSPPIQ